MGAIFRRYFGLFLPKISDERSYEKLRKQFNLQTLKPASLLDQFEVFRELASGFPERWQSEILIFSGDWFEQTGGEWLKFSYYLHTVLVSNTAYLRNQIVLDYLFSCALRERNLKPNPYLVNTVRHLFLIAEGAAPGFKFASDDSVIPLVLLESIIMDTYELKDYLPSFMHLGYLTETNGNSVYYSLEVPTLLDFQPRSREASKLQDLIQISRILRKVIPAFAAQGRNVENGIIDRITKGISYDCYHHARGEGINLLEDLINHDSILYNLHEKYPDRTFCSTNSFMRGCVRISKDRANKPE